MTFLLIYTATIAGCFLYRMRGGAPSWPRPIEQMMFCLVFPVVLYALGVPALVCLIAYAISVLACCTGHGQYFLALGVLDIEPEKMDFIVQKFFGKDPRTDERFREQRKAVDFDSDVANVLHREIKTAMVEYGWKRLYWRGVTGMVVTGLIISLAPGIVLAAYHPLAGIALAVSGAWKGAAYLIADKLRWGTEGGEYGYGGGQYLLAVLVLVLS